ALSAVVVAACGLVRAGRRTAGGCRLSLRGAVAVYREGTRQRDVAGVGQRVGVVQDVAGRAVGRLGGGLVQVERRALGGGDRDARRDGDTCRRPSGGEVVGEPVGGRRVGHRAEVEVA